MVTANASSAALSSWPAASKRAAPDASPPASTRSRKLPRVDTQRVSTSPTLAAVDEPPPPSTAAQVLLQTLAPSAASLCSWRLPPSQPLSASEQFLNEQLVHVASAAALERSAVLRRLGLLDTEGDDRAGADSADAVCQLSLVENVWAVVNRQVAYTAAGKQKLQLEKDAAERSVRAAMDLVSLLLYLREQEIARHNELDERIRELETDLQRRSRQVQALTVELEASRQGLAQQENRFRAKELAVANERKVAQTEKKALEVMVARLQGVETAFKAQLRRKDAEYERLRKNLQDAVTRSSKESRGIAVGKPLNSVTERRRTAQLAQSHENHLTKQIMENLERKKAELLFENDALVNSYDALQRQLEQLTAQYRKAAHLFLAKRAPDGHSEELHELISVPLDDFVPSALQMPSKQHLPEYISKSMDVLQNKLGQFEAAMRVDLERSAQTNRDEAVKVLQRKLAEAHELIAEQDQLLQASLINQPVGSMLALEPNDSIDRRYARQTNSAVESRRTIFGGDLDAVRLEELAEDVARQKHELDQKQEHVDEERELLRKQATKLDQDRLEFEIEKQGLVFNRLRTSSDDGIRAHPSSRAKPVQRGAALQRTDTGVDLTGSPLRVPVPASPKTAALLQKMGIVPFDDEFTSS